MARHYQATTQHVPDEYATQIQDAGMVDADEEEVGRLELMPSVQVPVKESIASTARELAQNEEEKIKNWVRGFCRLAIFCENRRAEVRREDVTKKVFDGDKTAIRIFPALFKQVQRQLRKTLAMELVPLRARGQVNEALAQQKRATRALQGETMALHKKDAPSPDMAKAWVLRSVLPPSLRQEMMIASRRIAREVGPNSDENRVLSQVRPADTTGMMVDWQRADAQLGSMGLLYLVLGIILLSGRELPDSKLRAYLARLGLSTSSALPSALRPDVTYPPGKPNTELSSITARQTDQSPHTVNDWLEVLTRHQYLEIENKKATITGQRQRRTHSSRNNKNREGEQESDAELVWKWGGRAEVEVGEEAAASFIVDIMEDGIQVTVDEAGEPLAPDQGSRRTHRLTRASQQPSLHDSLMQSVERAVGSQFVN